MKTKYSLLHLLTIFLAPSLLTATVTGDTITIQVRETFDYPGATETHPWAINDSNEIAGFYSRGQVGAGFTRTADGQFSAPIIEPDDTHHSTSVTGINNTGTICGTFWGADDVHSFLLSNGTFTQYDVPISLGHGTTVLGINDAREVAGYYYTPQNVLTGFFTSGGVVTPVNIPNGDSVRVHKINNLNQLVGYYDDLASGNAYGYFTGRNGKLKYPVAPPDSVTTFLYGINDRGWMVGNYNTQTGHNRISHGLLFLPPDQYVTFDYGNSPVLFGINRAGYICGFYQDGITTHGLLARVRRSTD